MITTTIQLLERDMEVFEPIKEVPPGKESSEKRDESHPEGKQDNSFMDIPEDKELRQKMLARYKNLLHTSQSHTRAGIESDSSGDPPRMSTAPPGLHDHWTKGLDDDPSKNIPVEILHADLFHGDSGNETHKTDILVNSRKPSAASRAGLSSSRLMIDRQSQTPNIFLTDVHTRPSTEATLERPESQVGVTDRPASAFMTIEEETTTPESLGYDSDEEENRRKAGYRAIAFADYTFDSDEYDTDLEEPDPGPIDPDVRGEKLYLKLCQALNIIPVTYFLRNIESETFNMQYRGMGPKGARAMASPLAMNTNIAKCNLRANMLDAEGAKYFSAMLDYNCYITEIDLSCNNIGSEGAVHICHAFCSNTTVRKVNLSENGFKDTDAYHFAEILEQNIHLRELKLSKNEFSSHGACILGPAIASNDTLEVLDLSWNHIRLQGALEIAKGVAVNVRLKELDLHMNGLADAGARMMGQALIHNCTLEDLNLDNNRMSTGAVIDLAEALKKNTTLVKLKLSNNPVLYDGAIALANAILANSESTMQLLDLNGYIVMEEFMEVVDQIKERQTFDVIVGSVTKGKKLEENIFIFNDADPLEILLIFMSEKNLRLMDLFKSLDKDQSMSLTREEFITGLQEVKTPLTVAQYEELMDMLDKDGDGEIDLAEILNINKEFKEVKFRARKKYEDQVEMEKQAKQKNAKKNKNDKIETPESLAESKDFNSAIQALMDRVKKKKETENTSADAPKSEEDKKKTGLSAINKWKKLAVKE